MPEMPSEAKMKACTCCLTSKPLSDFGLQKSWNGKRYPKSVCRACATAKAVEWAKSNLAKRRAIWRRHAESNRAAYRDANKRYYQRSREERIEAQRQRRIADNRIRTNARALLAHYVKTGKIVRGPCQKCGSMVRIHGHHHDYSKPLEVTWLCSLCHGKEHRRVA